MRPIRKCLLLAGTALIYSHPVFGWRFIVATSVTLRPGRKVAGGEAAA